MILRKWRIENPAISAAVGISKNILILGWVLVVLVAVSVNIVFTLLSTDYLALDLPMPPMADDLIYLLDFSSSLGLTCVSFSTKGTSISVMKPTKSSG
jgi:hypothetical protein